MKRERDLGDIVLSWSIEDILDDGLYKDEVHKIPDAFSSIDHYLEAFAAPLIEETRTELCSSLEMLSEAAFSNVLSMEEAGPTKKDEYTSQYIYYIDVDFCKNEKGDGGDKYKARNGDIFILSCMKLEAVEDLSRSGVTYCMALVTEVAMDDEFQKGFKVKVSKPIDLKNDISNYNFAIFLTNILTEIRISRALDVTVDMNKNFELIKTVLSPNYMVDATCDSCLHRQRDVQLTRFSDALLATNLNQSQADAVKAAISLVQCTHLNSVKLIWGPPGTGKTKTTSVILWELLCMKYRTLTCAPTNVAVVGVCLRLLQLIKQLLHCNNVNALPSLGDIVLFGNQDRMDITDELADVFLDNRVDQLADCFAPSSGWKYRMATMINFLENCISEYDLFIENSTDEVTMSLFEFVRKRFDAIAFPLRSCLRSICVHIPTSSISKENSIDMVALLENLETFGSVLLNEIFTEEELKTIFSNENPDVECWINSNTGKRLVNGRTECLRTLRNLYGSLNLPYAVEKFWIRNYCLQKAKLIFCTASTSSLLHYVKMEPLDVLVIDEAAQLKECESTIPLRLNWLKNAILVGDERQLPSLVKSQVSKDAGFGLSLFERLESQGYHKHLLNVQYRMHPSISFFPNVRFYEKQLLNGPNVEDSSYGKNNPDFRFGTYAFIHLADGKEEADDYGNSRKNMVEVAVILHLVRSLFKSMNGSGQNLSIGVLSPYSAQVQQINEKLRNKYDLQSGFTVRVRSIDGFQGQEDDVIILSTVRSNNSGVVGFLRDFNRTNVALTRARHYLWILGNATTLSRSGTTWEELVRDALNRKCFVDASDDRELSKVILHAKHELNQLEDLLNSDSAFLNSARWKILFSDDFRKSFAKSKSLQFKREIIQMLLKLADGWRSKRKYHGFADSYDLAKVYRIRDMYITWSVDVVKHERYLQVIKVWDLSSAGQTTRLIKRLDNIFSMYTELYMKHCRDTCIEGKLEVPMSWKIGQDIIRYKKLCRPESSELVHSEQLEDEDVMENSKVSESLLLMKFYSLSSGVVKHLLSASDGTEIDIPYELTEQEVEIIRFTRSAFILGRSGTGKTTVLTMKLIQKEQQHYIASEGIYCAKNDISKSAVNSSLPDIDSNEQNILRQVFITVSPKLCSAISNHIYRLKSFVSGGDSSTAAKASEMLDISDNITDFVDIPDSFNNLRKKHYPLVVTFWKFLMMLDGSIGNSFFDKYYDESGILVESGVSKSHALQAFIHSKEVNYERFVGSYWPHFNIQLTKKLDASTVFTQIISHIKGGLQSGKVDDGKLRRKDYIMLSEKRVSSLSIETREMIYDIFIDYEIQKRVKREFDLSDFVIDLHCRIIHDGYFGNKVDFVYIDEVQDLTMRQIALFKHVCTNFLEGFIFAGDTAQTIARGIDFRFEDIRSLFYTEFLSELTTENQVKMHGREVPIRDMFQLNQNFRTHAGVLKLAQSIIDLLYNFFPLCVDKLIPETSLIYGEAPVLLESDNNENAIITIFGSRGSSGYVANGFGSEQVILVRDAIAKKQVLDLVGKQALVLTILECKGLEFQDVLLYNFFGESPLKNKWRVVYQHMENEDILDPSITRSFPSFDEAKHNLLCSELKQLYVAITRTRQRLWICESTDEFSKPMFDYWKSLCLVQQRHLDSSLAQAMRAASSSEDWKLRGIKLFNEGNYEMATMCFERAGDEYREKWAKAAGLYSTADLIISTNFEMGENALKRAADIYESIGKSETAAMCYIKLKDFRKAGLIYLEKCGISRLEDAGDCLSLAECWSLAAEVYSKAKCFTKCLSICSKAELFDEGLQFLTMWKEDTFLDEKRHQELGELEMSYLESCAHHLCKLRNYKHMMKFVKSFHSLDLIRSFLKSNDLLNELQMVEVEMGNYLEAATICKIKGDILKEADMLEKACHFREATKLILLHVVVSTLWSPGSKGWPLKTILQNDSLLEKAKHIAGQDPETDSFYRSVCSDVYILSSSTKELMDLSRLLDEASEYKNVRLEVFILRSILDFHLKSEPSKYQWVPKLVFDVETHTNRLLCQNKFSTETLIHIWNILKARILEVLAYISSFETSNDSDQIYEEFCLEYFGVRKEDRDKYVVLNSEAIWIKNNNFLLHDEKWITGHQFRLCAQQYWGMELQSLGMTVLEKLESLHNYSRRNEVSLFLTGRLILHIYDVASYLNESKSLPNRSGYKLEKFFSLCQRCFPDIVFPLDWKNGISECMITLLENGTAQKVLELCLLENLKSRNGILTHGQVGSMVAYILLAGEFTDELFIRINKFLDQMPLWKYFMKELKNFLDLGFGRIQLVCQFKDALESTFLSDWRTELDYISPHCFIRLVECLMSFGTSCQGFRGYFYSTRSSFFEMLKCQASKVYLSACFTTPDAQFRNPIDSVLGFIINMIQSLISDRRSIQYWIKKSFLPRMYYPMFMLKIIILLCLGYLNIGRDISEIKKLLLSSCILEDLPRSFSEKLSQAVSYENHNWTQVLRILADALQEAGDPLVVVCSQESYSQFSNLNACVISSEKIKCRANAISMLFPAMAVIQHKESLKAPREKLQNRMPISTKPCSVINSKGKDTSNITSTTPAVPQNLKVQTRNEDKANGNNDNDLSENCNDLSENCNDASTKSAQLEMECRSHLVDSAGFFVNLDLENVNRALRAGVTWLEQKHCGCSLLGELRVMLHEFNLLSLSNDVSEGSSPRTKELYVKWKKWDPWLQTLMASCMVDDQDVTAELLQSLPGIDETRGPEEVTFSEAADTSSTSLAQDINKVSNQDDGEASGSEEDSSENVAYSTGAGCSNGRKGNMETGGASLNNQSKNQKKKQAKNARKKSKGKGKGKKK